MLNCEQGEAGINLAGRLYNGWEIYTRADYPSETDFPELPMSNIVHNGTLYDFESLTGAQAALATPGPEPQPQPPEPFQQTAAGIVMTERPEHAFAPDRPWLAEHFLASPASANWLGSAAHVVLV